MTLCGTCKTPLVVGRHVGSDVLLWVHEPGVLTDGHEPDPEGEGVVRLAAANRSLKLAADTVQRGGSTRQMAETLRLCQFQIAAFRGWALSEPDQQIAGAPEVDPEFDASRAFIPDTPEGL